MVIVNKTGIYSNIINNSIIIIYAEVHCQSSYPKRVAQVVSFTRRQLHFIFTKYNILLETNDRYNMLNINFFPCSNFLAASAYLQKDTGAQKGEEIQLQKSPRA